MFKISLPWLYLFSYNTCPRYLKSRRDLLYEKEKNMIWISEIPPFNWERTWRSWNSAKTTRTGERLIDGRLYLSPCSRTECITNLYEYFCFHQRPYGFILFYHEEICYISFKDFYQMFIDPLHLNLFDYAGVFVFLKIALVSQKRYMASSTSLALIHFL